MAGNFVVDRDAVTGVVSELKAVGLPEAVSVVDYCSASVNVAADISLESSAAEGFIQSRNNMGNFLVAGVSESLNADASLAGSLTASVVG